MPNRESICKLSILVGVADMSKKKKKSMSANTYLERG